MQDYVNTCRFLFDPQLGFTYKNATYNDTYPINSYIHGSYRGCKKKIKDFLRTFQGLTRYFQGLFFAAGTSLCRRLIL